MTDTVQLVITLFKYSPYFHRVNTRESFVVKIETYYFLHSMLFTCRSQFSLRSTVQFWSIACLYPMVSPLHYILIFLSGNLQYSPLI